MNLVVLKLLPEVVGVFIFFSGILSAVRGAPNAILLIGLSLTLAAIISGGHLNPAVTAMFFLKENDYSPLAVEAAGLKVVGQLLGMLLAHIVSRLTFPASVKAEAAATKAKPAKSKGFAGLVGEFVGSLIFFSGILKAVELNLGSGTALIVGLSLYIAASIVGNASGGHLNPAVSVMALLKGWNTLGDVALYIPIQIVAGGAALKLSEIMSA
jgi:glycerol uptake facilitator-like aquaporin|tara:strand:- start:1040 stop:1675 length:636 start_codon:yes stop_codon:yes gene_type:complete